METLEDRCLMAVVWANQGTATNNSDQFNTTFGANAMLARAIVNEAIADWNRIITGAPNNLSLTINGANLAGSTLGQATVNTTSPTGVPTTATIALDNDAATVGWFFDPTPENDSEFSNLVTIFAGTTTVTTQVDFYTNVLHEIWHALGYNTHSTDANDLMFPSQPVATRRLISDTTAQLLANTYGYTRSIPSSTDTLYVNYDSSTSVATAIGAPGLVNDVVLIDKVSPNGNGLFTRFRINGTTELVPGLFGTSFTLSTGAGNDSITIDNAGFYGGGTIDAGAGSDLLRHNSAWADYDTVFQNNAITRNYLLIGPSGYYGSLVFAGAEDVILGGTIGADLITIGGGNSYNFLRVLGGDGNDVIAASNANARVFIYGEEGNDNISGSAFADILVGGNGNDTITGGAGKDIIIGGNGIDSIFAQFAGDEDIVITGRTSLDAASSANALLGILNEWNSTRTRAQRIANINGTGTGTRLNTSFLTTTTNSLSTQTVFDDSSPDNWGIDTNVDWFFAT